MTNYRIRDPKSIPFEALCDKLQAMPDEIVFIRSRNGDASRKDHAYMGGWWYVHTDGKVDLVPGDKFGFEAVAPVRIEAGRDDVR